VALVDRKSGRVCLLQKAIEIMQIQFSGLIKLLIS
jgi:hypothetical protein